jgi:hypothetical protein
MTPTADASAVGFTVKSGWACEVLLAGPLRSPRLVDSRRVELCDPANPKARQPYHASFGTARKAGADLSALIASVKQFGRRSVTNAIRARQKDGLALTGIGIVVGSLIDPAEIANDHIRIHALEGQLFRAIVQGAADRLKLPSSMWRERDLYGVASTTLKRTEPELRQALASLGKDWSGPWRAEHKAAALAAWIVLAGAKRPRSG